MNQITTLHGYKLFSFPARSYATNVKKQLDHLMRNGTLVPDPRTVKRMEEKERYRYKGTQKSQYNHHQARRILKTNFGIDGHINEKLKLGPTSDDDLEILARTRDKRLIYTILGITGEQLRNSLLVYKDVKKFLMRNQVEKALYLTKLAKSRGAASMNLVIEYYLKEMHLVDAALSLYNWRKKMRIPMDKYTNTILFDGISKQKKKISKKHGEQIYNIAQGLIKNEECNIIEFNSALNALANCEDFKLPLQLYESIEQDSNLANAKYNSITFMALWKTCDNVDTLDHFIEVFNGLIKAIPAKTCDSKLMLAVVKSLINRSSQMGDNTCLLNTALMALNKYFEEINFDLENLPIETRLNLPEINYWGKETKFPLTIHVSNLVIDVLLKSEKFMYGIRFYQILKKNHHEFIDELILLSYMKCLTNGRTSGCVQESLKELIELKQKWKIDLYNKRIMIEMYQGFKRQSQKMRIYADLEASEETMVNLDKFIKNYDFVVVNGNEKIYSPNSWKFVFNIVRKINCENKLQLLRLEHLLIQLLKNVINELLFGDNILKLRDDLATDRYLSEATVNLVENYIKKVVEMKKTDSKLQEISSELKSALFNFKLAIIKRSKYIQRTFANGKAEAMKDETNMLALKQLTINVNNSALALYKVIK